MTKEIFITSLNIASHIFYEIKRKFYRNTSSSLLYQFFLLKSVCVVSRKNMHRFSLFIDNINNNTPQQHHRLFNSCVVESEQGHSRPLENGFVYVWNNMLKVYLILRHFKYFHHHRRRLTLL